MRTLKNFGATCYVNALVQALTGLHRAPLLSSENEQAASQKQCTAKALFDFCRNGSPELKHLVALVTKRFGAGQQDAHDLWTAVADEVFETDKTLFHGSYVVRIVCRECGHAQERREDFPSLALKRSVSQAKRGWEFTPSLHALMQKEKNYFSLVK